ncbi:hypothetical protein R6Q57_011528 [Mikania cordata]
MCKELRSTEAEGDSFEGVKNKEDNRIVLDSQISETMIQEIVKIAEKLEQKHVDKEEVDAKNDEKEVDKEEINAINQGIALYLFVLVVQLALIMLIFVCTGCTGYIVLVVLHYFVLQKIVSLYIEKESPILYKRIVNLEPKKLDMTWQIEKNFVNCGIFAMRHIATYMGKEMKEWKEYCGLLDESSGKQRYHLLDLRYNYLSKILFLEVNILHDQVTKEIKKSEELDEAVKKQMIRNAHKRI